MLPANFKVARKRVYFWLHRTGCLLRLRLRRDRGAQACAITIITPTYKRVPLLREAIESVLQQTFSDWEHIVVADGHDPEVEQLVKSFGETRLRYLPSQRFACSGNLQRNLGLAHASGTYVFFLDDDNLIYPDALAGLHAELIDSGLDYVVAPIHYDGDTTMAPSRDFVLGEIDSLCFMARRRLVAKAGGWRNAFEADYLLIDAIRRIAQGRYIIRPIVGCHR